MTTTAAGATYAAEALSVPDDIQHSPLWNKDLAPTPLSRRTWSTYNIAALWIGMSVVITTYTLASGLMQEGMTWWQALMTILLGNVIVLIPMVLNAHAGTKYGISFPVMCRASFGVRGANIPAMLRAVVACGREDDAPDVVQRGITEVERLERPRGGGHVLEERSVPHSLRLAA